MRSKASRMPETTLLYGSGVIARQFTQVTLPSHLARSLCLRLACTYPLGAAAASIHRVTEKSSSRKPALSRSLGRACPAGDKSSEDPRNGCNILLSLLP